jgi:hypothetical protein
MKMSKVKRGIIAPKAAKDNIIAFFKNVLERRFSEAEREIKKIRDKNLGNDDFMSGYLNALEGIVTSIRSGDERDFINKLPQDDKSMRGYKRSFGEFLKGDTQDSFDKGYFSAWSDIIHYKLNSSGR